MPVTIEVESHQRAPEGEEEEGNSNNDDNRLGLHFLPVVPQMDTIRIQHRHWERVKREWRERGGGKERGGGEGGRERFFFFLRVIIIMSNLFWKWCYLLVDEHPCCFQTDIPLDLGIIPLMQCSKELFIHQWRALTIPLTSVPVYIILNLNPHNWGASPTSVTHSCWRSITIHVPPSSPSFTLTDIRWWWFPRVHPGCDEYHLGTTAWLQVMGRGNGDQVQSSLLLWRVLPWQL